MKNGSLLCFIISILLYGFIIRDYQTENQTKQREVSRKELEIKQLQAGLADLHEKKESLGNSLDISYQRIPQENEQEEVIRDLRDISDSSKFVFDDLSFAKGFHNDIETHQLIVNFSVRGPFPKLFRFLQAIENNVRFMGMKDIRLSISEDEDTGQKNVSTDISLYVLYQD